MRTLSDKPGRGKSSTIKLLIFNPKRKHAAGFFVSGFYQSRFHPLLK
jgi:hypothetical protein